MNNPIREEMKSCGHVTHVQVTRGGPECPMNKVSLTLVGPLGARGWPPQGLSPGCPQGPTKKGTVQTFGVNNASHACPGHTALH